MGRISELDTVIKDLRSAAAIINEAANTLAEMFGTTADEAPDAAVPAEPRLTLEQVRAILADKSRRGYTAEVKALLRQHGADKLSEIAPSEYEALLTEVEALGND